MAKKASKPEPKAAKVVAKPPVRPPLRRVAKPPQTVRRDKPDTARTVRAAPAAKPRPAPTIRPERPSPPVPGAGCPFSREELTEWRRVLLSHRSEISQDIQHLERDAMEAEDGHTTPNHIAERGSDAEMQDMSLGLAGEEQAVLWQIDRALRKIDSGQPLAFGLCEHTRQPIPRTRLQLIPWTPVSIEGMNHVEEHGLALEDVLVDG